MYQCDKQQRDQKQQERDGPQSGFQFAALHGISHLGGDLCRHRLGCGKNTGGQSCRLSDDHGNRQGLSKRPGQTKNNLSLIHI